MKIGEYNAFRCGLFYFIVFVILYILYVTFM